MRVAAVQMTSGPNRSQNLAHAHDLLLAAIARQAELIAFPENFSLMSDDPKQVLASAETIKGTLVETLQEWAAEYDVWIVGGSIPLRVPGDSKRVTNTMLVVSPEGKIEARYDKLHLFDAELKDRPYKESRSVKAGTRPVSVKLPFGRAGLSICYDLRFPELYRKYSRDGAVALFAPSAFTELTGRAHWDVLTRARAIENQCYLIAPAQTGKHEGGRSTYGHARIVDPWGRVIAERMAGPGVIWADINPNELSRIRREMPVLKHRRK